VVDLLWDAQALRAADFLNMPRFEQPIVSTNGRMASTRTIDPSVFVDFRQRMPGLPDRETATRQRDGLLAALVQEPIEEGPLLPH